MSPDEQPTILTAPPNGSRPALSGVWQVPSVEEMQAKLPQYEVLEILGRGGMGAVYKGRQKSLKRLVAIKILPLGLADDEFKFAERFQNEAQTMAAMNHPAIVSVYDFGETADGLLFFIMEFVDGTDVQKMIQSSGRLSGEHALAITAHVCDALAYAHARGVIHRDIKPANILIDQEGHIKVADFGLAKMSDPSQTSGLTKTNMAMGTPDYVAPEVLSPGTVADHRADLYAVGVMLYQMLTGEVPRGMFKLPSQKGIGSDPRFDEIICKAMEQDREERYQSAAEVRQALDVILTTPQAKNDGTGIVSAQKPVATKAKAPPKKSSQATTWLSIGIVAVLGVAAFFIFGGQSTPNPNDASVSNRSAQTEKKSPLSGAEPQPLKGKLSPSFFISVAKTNGPRQVELVGEKIKELNGVGVNLVPKIEKGVVTQLVVKKADEAKVPDLSPIAALTDLKVLDVQTTGMSDLAWVRGMKLDTFSADHAAFTDLKPLAELPLMHFTLKFGPERDYSVLAGMKLRTFVVRMSPVRDVSFLKGMPLVTLDLDQTGFNDWSAIRGMPLVDWRGDFVPERDADILRSIPTLQKINGKLAAEFWAGIGTVAKTAAAFAGKTIDLLQLVDVKRDALAGEWSRDGAEVLVKAAKSDVSGAPRLQLPYQPPEEYDFEIEFTPESGDNKVLQTLSAYQRPFTWQVDVKLSAGMKAGFTQIGGKSFFDTTEGTAMRPSFLTNGQRHRSKVEVRKTGLRGFVDAKLLVAWGSKPESYQSLDIHPNDALRDALHLGIGAFDRSVRFHKITVREVTGAGKVDAGVAATEAKTDDLPNITNWQDVTEAVRENARGKTELVIEADSVRHSGKGNAVTIFVKDVSAAYHAVRVRYVGEVQVSMNFKDRATRVFVQAQLHQTIFSRTVVGQTTSTHIRPSVPHPAGFDPNQPHELIVAVRGTTLSVWLDGRFLGDAQDENLKESATSLIFQRYVTLQKVEIAELNAAR